MREFVRSGHQDCQMISKIELDEPQSARFGKVFCVEHLQVIYTASACL